MTDETQDKTAYPLLRQLLLDNPDATVMTRSVNDGRGAAFLAVLSVPGTHAVHYAVREALDDINGALEHHLKQAAEKTQ